MAYGELKVDSITFTNGGTDTTVSVSGLVQNPTFSGDVTVTGTISGSVVQGGTLVSGATVSGTAGEFGTITGNTAGFTNVTGTTVTGTTANFVTVSGTTVTGETGQFTSITGGTAGFTTVTGTTVTGTTANFATLSGTTVTGGTGQFTSLTSTTATITSGVFASGTAAAPSISVGTTDNGIYSPGTDQVAISTNGTGQLFVDTNGNVGVGTSSPSATLHVRGSSAPRIENTGTESLIRFQNSSAENVYFGSNTSNAVIYTQSTERFRIDSSGNVGIGTSSPAELLDIDGSGDSYLRWESNGGTGSYSSLTNGGLLRIGPTNGATDRELALFGDNSSTFWVTTGTNKNLNLGTNKIARITIDASGKVIFKGPSSEFARIDTAGRLLVGASSPITTAGGRIIQIEYASGPDMVFGRSSTSVGANAPLAALHFYSNGGSTYEESANIEVFADDVHAAGDKPGRLVFSTTADGSSSPTERMRIDSSGNVGIGTTSPGVALHVDGDIRADGIYGETDTNTSIQFPGSDVITFNEGGSEAARIDSSGRLLVGTSTYSSTRPNAAIHLDSRFATAGYGNISLGFNGTSASNQNVLTFYRTRGTSAGSVDIVQSGDSLGGINFNGADGVDVLTAAASIKADVDGTPGANDMPGRLVFSTTADGASSPTERMRITSTGQVRLAGAGITFNGDTATANELDDYEEGTWTPVGISAVGRYTKTGNIVTLYLAADNNNNNNNTNPITGLPFTVSSFPANIGGTGRYYALNTNGTTEMATGAALVRYTNLYLMPVITTLSTGAGARWFSVTVTYTTGY